MRQEGRWRGATVGGVVVAGELAVGWEGLVAAQATDERWCVDGAFTAIKLGDVDGGKGFVAAEAVDEGWDVRGDGASVEG